MKLSTRNLLKGKVTSVAKGQAMSNVKVEIGTGEIITALISTEAVLELELNVGDKVKLLIKATEVMVGK